MNDYVASDPRSIRRAAKAAKQAESDRAAVIFTLMSTPMGRAYMYDRLVRCHCFVTSFSLDPGAMAFAEGERNIGLQDFNDIVAHAPDQYIQMMREATDKEQAHGRRSDDRPSRDLPDDGRDDNGRAESEYDPGSVDD